MSDHVQMNMDRGFGLFMLKPTTKLGDWLSFEKNLFSVLQSFRYIQSDLIDN